MSNVVTAHMPPWTPDEINDAITHAITPNDCPVPSNTLDHLLLSDSFKPPYSLETEEPQKEPTAGIIPDMVNHPSHYALDKYECKEVLKEVLKDLDGYEGFCIGNVIKYCWRLKRKGKPIEDAKKAKFYINDCIEYMEGKE